MQELFVIQDNKIDTSKNPFIDIKLIDKVDERVNFIIKCENEEELSELKKILYLNKKMITFSEFKKKYENTIN